MSQIPLCKPYIPDIYKEDADKIIKSGKLVNGEYVKKFEDALAEYLGVKYVVCVSSGTAALHLGYMAYDVEGKYVMVPSLTFPATVNTLYLAGGKPYFIDNNKDEVNLSLDSIKKISGLRKTGEVLSYGLVLVNNFGLPIDKLEEIREIFSYKRNFFIAEDAACSLGSCGKDRKSGTKVDWSVLSFHPRKIITTGEGGAFITDNEYAAKVVRSLRNHGLPDCFYPGLNYRMTELQAAMGLRQLEMISDIINKRRKDIGFYKVLLTKKVLPKIDNEVFWNGQSFFIQVKEEDRDVLINLLKENNIEAQIGCYSVAHTKFFDKTKEDYLFREGDCDNAKSLYKTLIALPIYYEITKNDICQVVNVINSFYKGDTYKETNSL